MRTFTLKGLFVTAVFMLLGCLTIHAADGDLITKQITIKLEKAGTLQSKIGDTKKYKITNLKIMGEINGTDLLFIRKMAGRDETGSSTEGKLATLDLSGSKIVKGGYYYYAYDTSDDVIGVYAFKDCSGLTSLTLPYSVTTICKDAFEGCSGLTSLTLPSSVSSIDVYAFRYCNNLKECNCLLDSDLETYLARTHDDWISIPVDEIKYYHNGQELTKLEIPSGVDKIGSYSFYKGVNLTSLTLPSSVSSIDYFAFYGCSGLTSLTLPSSVTSVDYYAFYGCNNLKECNCLLDSDLETYLARTHDDWISIPVDEIKYYHNGQELTKLEIPSGVDKIGSCSFYKGVNLTSLTLPSSVTSIGSSAFKGCSGLTSLTLPSSVSSIGASAFYGCSSLTSLTLPSSVSSIGASAFSGCSSLTSLTLPSSVSSIGASAFSGCSGLTSIYVSWESPLPIDASTFGYANTKKCILYVPEGTYDDYWISNWGIFENIVEYDATGINHITTSGNVKEISRYAADGQRLEVPAKGLNIVKYSDGCVKKVVVQ